MTAGGGSGWLESLSEVDDLLSFLLFAALSPMFGLLFQVGPKTSPVGQDGSHKLGIRPLFAFCNCSFLTFPASFWWWKAYPTWIWLLFVLYSERDPMEVAAWRRWPGLAGRRSANWQLFIISWI